MTLLGVPFGAAVLGGAVAGCAVLAVAAVGAWASAAGRRAVAQSRLSGSPAGGAAPAWFGSALRWADAPVAGEDVWPSARLLALGGGSVFVLAAPWLAVLGVAAGGAAALAWPAVARRRQAARFHEQLPASLDEVMASLRAGSSLIQALEAAARRPGPVGQDVARLLTHYSEGVTLQDALDSWAARQPAAVLLADALALAGATGASQVRALAGVSAGLRERQALAREVRALGAQARLSAVVMVVTPVAFAAIVGLVDPRIRLFLVGTLSGWVCLALGALLDLIGAWWMHRLVAGVGR